MYTFSLFDKFELSRGVCLTRACAGISLSIDLRELVLCGAGRELEDVCVSK